MNLYGCLNNIFIIVFRKLHPKNINLCGTNLRKVICGIFTIFKANPKIKSDQSFKLTELQKLVLQHFSKWHWKVTENTNKTIQPITIPFLASNAKEADLKSFVTNTKKEVWTKMDTKQKRVLFTHLKRVILNNCLLVSQVIIDIKFHRALHTESS